MRQVGSPESTELCSHHTTGRQFVISADLSRNVFFDKIIIHLQFFLNEENIWEKKFVFSFKNCKLEFGFKEMKTDTI